MTYHKIRSIKNRQKEFYILGITLVCGFLLISADDCESAYLAEQQHAMEQKARQEQGSSVTKSNAQDSQSKTALSSQPGTQTSTGNIGSTSGTQAGSAGTGTTSGTQASAGGSTTSGTQGGTGTSGASGTQSGSEGTTTTPGTQAGSAGTGTTSGTQAVAGVTGTPAQSGTTGSTGSNYITSISGKNWKLSELRFADRTVTLNRNELSADQVDFFTLAIDNERISGRAAPNRYMTSYQAGANNALTIQPIASTMMALIVSDPQRIQEPEYFQYLGKVKSWKINQNKLELTTADAANKTLTMVFMN